ncbi:UDP-N-acetylmuramoyl-L-alanyl-D-glutamate--2,6-diaminopimelate ligase [Arsenicitalea aurantiaca]|uniref:UDP-N-acetylmuramoyl-L-alanyl-D-glutamate--2,6-diaminopimelate ligase n=1 Tax=Arsenicitalea aurantiaca TaxID=1783274 RepID=A0A433XMB1_9HYPH|nr:UDP-N-acetylmuramoyl-L-alanyl-D-glutamate--2,6-diaminopimelate ligase [Arsenicitalea aurantiaca]
MPELSVQGLNADSRALGAGEAFFALPGSSVHGDRFAADAAARGAAIMVSDRAPDSDPGLPVIVVDDVRAAYARAAARAHALQPSVAVAVTGTNGKTSVAAFTRQIWEATGRPAASLGTLGVETAQGLVPGALTTPDSLTLHRDLQGLASRGIQHVALEASSHGLDQRRLDGMSFEAVAFTNLSRDHLDYHPDMASYRNAKLRLFTDLLRPGGTAVVNLDDAEAGAFCAAAEARGARIAGIGREGSFFSFETVENEGYGQRISGRLAGRPVSFHLPLTGAFQVHNALTALALAMATGVAAEDGLAALPELKGAKGRLELVGQHNGAAVFVDYSHKPVALETALLALRPYASGQLHLVFGAGGDRDRGKRPMMGEVAVRLADRVIVTDDNPRTEDAASIRAEILAAAPGAREIGDRREAIGAAVATLQPGDVLLVAGKGHEDYQIIGTTKHHFSDHEVVAEAIRS